jgi:hypothetical protein
MLKFPSPASSDVMHRVLNFIEDVDREIQRAEIGAVRDINHYASGEFLVDISSTRRLGEVNSVISRLLKHHHLEQQATIVRSDRAKEHG